MVIHLSGPDIYRSQRRLRQLREAFRTKHDSAGLNTLTLDGETMTAEELRNATGTLGFFSPKRFIGINHYLSTSANCDSKTLSDILSPIAKQPDVIVVLREVPAPTSNRRVGARGAARRPKKSFITGAILEEFEMPSEMQRRHWVKQQVETRGGSIVPTAVAQLLAWCMEDDWRLEMEIEKLVVFADGQPITQAMVSALVRAPEESDVFALTDALGQRDTAAALRHLQRELQAGTNPIAVVSILATHLKNLLLVQTAMAEGLPSNQIASQLKLHPFVVQKAAAQSRAFSRETLIRWHHQLIGIDATIKSSRLDPETLLDEMFVRA